MNETINADSERNWEILRTLYGDGVPLFVVVFVVQTAAVADTLVAFLRLLYREKQKPTVFTSVFDTREWMGYYYSHRNLINTMFKDEGDSDAQVTDVTDVLRNFRYLDADTQRSIVSEFVGEYEEEAESLCKLLVGAPFPPTLELVEALVGALDAQEDESVGWFDEFIEGAAGRYFISVWVPCWFLYQTYPVVLLRKARRGCVDSFDRLLRIDKAVLSDPELSIRWQAIQRGEDKAVRRRLERA